MWQFDGELETQFWLVTHWFVIQIVDLSCWTSACGMRASSWHLFHWRRGPPRSDVFPLHLASLGQFMETANLTSRVEIFARQRPFAGCCQIWRFQDPRTLKQACFGT
jgi:hypothetical protein